jgi:type II secretory pathway component HofQ
MLRIAAKEHLNISIDPDVSGYVTCDLHGVAVDAALKAILKPLGLQFRRSDGVIVVSLVTPAQSGSFGFFLKRLWP